MAARRCWSWTNSQTFEQKSSVLTAGDLKPPFLVIHYWSKKQKVTFPQPKFISSSTTFSNLLLSEMFCITCTWSWSPYRSFLQIFIHFYYIHTGTSSVGTQVLLFFCGELLRTQSKGNNDLCVDERWEVRYRDHLAQLTNQSWSCRKCQSFVKAGQNLTNKECIPALMFLCLYLRIFF